MAKRTNIYFAIKLVAPRFGTSIKSVVTSSIMEFAGGKHSAPQAAKKAKAMAPKQFEIGKGEAHAYPGVADHFVAAILDFTDKENAQCKSLLEAEQLVKTKKKYWLTDAYDWFVMPGYVNETLPAGISGTGAAKSPKLAKKSSPSTSKSSKKTRQP